MDIPNVVLLCHHCGSARHLAYQRKNRARIYHRGDLVKLSFTAHGHEARPEERVEHMWVRVTSFPTINQHTPATRSYGGVLVSKPVTLRLGPNCRVRFHGRDVQDRYT